MELVKRLASRRYSTMNAFVLAPLIAAGGVWLLIRPD